MFQLYLPVDIRMNASEFVAAGLPAAAKRSVPIAVRPVDQIGTSLIKCHGVDGRADADIVDDGRIGVAIAITGGGYLGDGVYENGFFLFSGYRPERELAHFFHDERGSFVPLNAYGFQLAGGDAAAAAGATFSIDARLSLDNRYRIMNARLEADAAAGAELVGHFGSDV